MIKTQSDLTEKPAQRGRDRTGCPAVAGTGQGDLQMEGTGQGDLQPSRRGVQQPSRKEKKNLVAKGNQDPRGTTRICALKTTDMTLEGREEI